MNTRREGKMKMANFGFMGCICITIAAALVSVATADTYTVGDSLGWAIPPGGQIAYSTWAAEKSFDVGDTIVFNWTGNHDVAEVSKVDYDNCTKSSPLSTILTSSPVNVNLTSNSTRYFICTVSTHCSLGQKVTIKIGETSSATLPLNIDGLSTIVHVVPWS